MAYTNPIEQVFDGLWEILEDSAEFDALVPVGPRRVKYIGGSRDPMIHGSTPSDFPQVCIEPVGGFSQAEWTSNSGKMKKTFQVKIATGDKRLDYKIFQVEWAIYRAMSNWRAVMSSLTWKGKAFVDHVGVYDHEETLKEREMSRGDTGWSTVWTGEVWMHFTTSDLIPDVGTGGT